MPHRKTVLVNEQYYHVFNRSINKEPIFVAHKDCKRGIDAINYYRFKNPPIRLSYFLAAGVEKRMEIIRELEKHALLNVSIISFCLMPNHFHFLLKQNMENGISKFLAQFQNSYTRYFNTKYDRFGHVFQGQFKAVRIEDDNQLIHVNRYIHLNPYTSYVVKTLKELEDYQYSSIQEYFQNIKKGFIDAKEVLSHFSTNASYREFIYNQADYQRTLGDIKHLIME